MSTGAAWLDRQAREEQRSRGAEEQRSGGAGEISPLPVGTPAPPHPSTEVDRLLVFSIGEEWYALEIHDVRGIERLGPITLVPGTPPFIAGVYNLRGGLLAILDVRRFLDLPAPEQAPPGHIIVGEAGGFTGGLLVDVVREILDVPQAQREPPLSTLEPGTSSYIAAQVHINGHLVAVLTLARLFQAAIQE